MTEPRHDQQPDHAPGTGILLTNLGTPDAPTTEAVRRYLKEFLSDPRVVEAPRWLWWLALRLVILPLRPRRSAAAYRTVWSEAGSPLLSISKHQAQALEAALQQQLNQPVEVVLAMRYGTPSIPGAIAELRRRGVQRILVFPLYPQYSATTTASTFDAVAAALRTCRHLPEWRMVPEYHDDPGYIEALAARIQRFWDEQDGPADRLLMSFHGIPERYHRQGDPYRAQCETTARLLAERLGLPEHAWAPTFQSRFGREPWLQPYTDETLKRWGREGVASVDVVCPGFSADCLETLEEISLQNRDFFLSAGGRQFRYIPALNDDPQHIQALARIAQRHMTGWLTDADRLAP